MALAQELRAVQKVITEALDQVQTTKLRTGLLFCRACVKIETRIDILVLARLSTVIGNVV